MCHPANIPGGSYWYAICIDDLYANREPRYYVEETPTLRSERSGLKVMTVGTVSPTSMIAGRVIDIDGICFTLMAQTHGYGQGNICDMRFIDEESQ